MAWDAMMAWDGGTVADLAGVLLDEGERLVVLVRRDAREELQRGVRAELSQST